MQEKNSDNELNALYRRTQEIENREQHFLQLIEGMSDAFYRMRIPDGIYEYMSPISKLVFGYSHEEFQKTPFLIKKIMHPDYKDYFSHKWAELLKGKVPRTYEYKIIDPRKNERWILQSNRGIFDDEENITAIEGICRDMTDSKRIEEGLLKAHEELEQRVEERTQELQEKIEELERFRAATVDRELRMKELRNEIEKLKAEKNRG